MKVFLSWSGDRAKAVAVALAEWLPLVIQSVKPFVSTSNIPKGARGLDVIASELEETRVGIVCVTPEGKNAPWLIFEAGALSKTRSATYVCTYLIGIRTAVELEPPLGQFQATLAEKEDTFTLMKDINNSQEEGALDETRLRTVFEKFWPDLEKKLALAVALPTETEPQQRPEREILEEILALVREQQARTPRETTPFLRAFERAVEDLMTTRAYLSHLATPSSLADTLTDQKARRLALERMLETEERDKKKTKGPEK